MTDVLEISRPRQKASDVETRENKPPRIVIVGGGLAGLAAARALRGCDAEIVLIDRRNHHIFQPLLYQAATANIPGLSGTSKNGPTYTRPAWSVLTPSMLNIGEGATPAVHSIVALSTAVQSLTPSGTSTKAKWQWLKRISPSWSRVEFGSPGFPPSGSGPSSM
jgi:choline dehydrogenase-like flavoprotein